MRISDWSSDVCSSDLPVVQAVVPPMLDAEEGERLGGGIEALGRRVRAGAEGIALENLMPGDLGLDEFFRLILENGAAMVGAEMILLAIVFGMALAQRQRVARVG